jgi:hypothetical protein
MVARHVQSEKTIQTSLDRTGSTNDRLTYGDAKGRSRGKEGRNGEDTELHGLI